MSDNEMPDDSEVVLFTVPEGLDGQRLDKALAKLCGDRSRSYLKNLIESECVEVDGDLRTNPSGKVSAGSQILLELPPPEDTSIEPEDIPLDIVYEDEDLLVINKSAGMVVHPGAGNKNHTLVNALLHHCRGQLSGIGGVARPGIVHRLDKDTSGLLVAAKTDNAHRSLSSQLADRTLHRKYIAVVLGVPVPVTGTIDMPIGRHRVYRQKMAIMPRGRNALTNYRVIDRCQEYFSVVECRLNTGRTHQIRVHMDAIKHPLIGDQLYGPQPTAINAAMRKAGLDESSCDFIRAFNRQALHAREIGFVHPSDGREMAFSAGLPTDMDKLIKLICDLT